MATHSSILAWKIPWAEEPGGLQSMGLQKEFGHDLVNKQTKTHKNQSSQPKAERRRIDAFELWCWRRVLRVPWTSKEIQPVHLKGDQSWVFTGRTDVEAETCCEEQTHWKRT